MIKKIGSITLMSALLLGAVGCAPNSDNAKQSTKSEKSVKSTKKKSDKSDKNKTPEELATKVADSIKLTGKHEYKMRHFDGFNMIDDSVEFTLVDGKLTKMQEISNHNEGVEPDIKKEADLMKYQDMVKEYEGSTGFSYELIDKGNDYYQTVLTYKLEDNQPEELLADSMLKDGKFDARQMVYQFAIEGYEMQ